jgi:hypothetical protein
MMDKREWKVGDMMSLKEGLNTWFVKSSKPLFNLPDPLTEAERRVVEAWMAHYDVRLRAGTLDMQHFPHELVDATTSLRDLRKPVDPVAELLKAFHEFRNGMSLGAQLRVLRAIAAIEKAKT